ncbi:oxidoreductase [Swaminathania salitolerans LMG 21291]|uniref:Oxidoreductase n=1 Tax=Swaminathania salitolerans TaxID=182838 RepID=A0A511BP31_9PROT|nr:oxidoreductase [Swaminathania salitolerans LMG 21291]GEL02025.1 oxidoreductase [Swaminathania salitolerans]
MTGASGGLGSALACHYAAPGIHITLWGRNEDRLARTASLCEAKGATTSVRAFGLTDHDRALSLLGEADAARPLDLVILNAGVSDIRPEGAVTERVEAVWEAALVNYAIPVALATEAASFMAGRRRGRIALIGSVAAHHDLPFATAYCSSKAGLARFSTCLHAAMTPSDVGVTLIEPSYIDTAMSRRLDGARPFLVTPEDAARRIARAIGRGQAVLVFPAVFLLLKFVSALMPRRIAHRLLRMARVKQNAR